ncbi:hypothetical protein [Streptomyces sp. NPDC058625]|uniref:hypothetical protein n=1 Tax=Streptomyces sp. NPDC058625 TaxID=3346564 RepID=UPI00364F1D82
MKSSDAVGSSDAFSTLRNSVRSWFNCADIWGWQPPAGDGNRGKYVWCDLAAV